MLYIDVAMAECRLNRWQYEHFHPPNYISAFEQIAMYE